MDPVHKRAIQRIISSRTSSWLTVLPLTQYHFDMTATEFRDALAIRYRKPLLGIPASCDGCGEAFDLDHALCCKKGGLIIQRHNEIRDAIGDLSNLVWNQVHREPVVRDADDSRAISALVADLGIRGVWEAQTVALLDIRVVHTDARSYISRSVDSVLSSAETNKKQKYTAACEARRASFTPFITSVDGVLGREAASFMKHVTLKLANKWQRSIAEVTSWTRTRLLFATLRATTQCIRGSRTKWRSLGVEDGASIHWSLSH
jgi:hypothetical protein